MKKILLSLFFMASVLINYGQSLSLTFTAKDENTQNDIYIDSVFVENAIRGCDTTLYGSGSILILAQTLGIGGGEIAKVSSLIVNQNIPNPFSDRTIVSIYLPSGGSLQLTLSDVTGKILGTLKNEYEIGLHKFEVSANGPGFFVLNVSNAKESKSIKMISLSSGHGNNSIKYLEGNTRMNFKSSATIQKQLFNFHSGDQMKFTASAAGNNHSYILDKPKGDTTYTFRMFAVPSLAGVSTAFPTTTSETFASGGGNVYSDGGSTVITRGVCWSTSPNPDTTDSHTFDGSGMGTFISSISNLIPNTQYYFRAYATNSEGIAYGNEIIYIPSVWQCGNPIIYEGRTYNTIKIGNQCWLKENLNVGNKIAADQYPYDNGIIEKYCMGNGDYDCEIYGGLYKWKEAMQYSFLENSQGICPAGWHIPSMNDCSSLIDELGGEEVAGGKLKEAGTLHWLAPNTGATNSSGFSALATGEIMTPPGNFYYFLSLGGFWMSTYSYPGLSAWCLGLYNFNSKASVGWGDPYFSISVRCIKD